MLLLISPAKTLDFSPAEVQDYTQPRFLQESDNLVSILARKSTGELKSLMNISEKLADLNAERYRNFSLPFNAENAKAAVLAFKGDVYTGLNADDFNTDDLEFSQQCIRVLSGLYGLLRPLDLMQPYRLEMGTKLNNAKGKNLYEFWGDKITDLINRDLSEGDNKSVVNLASNEYFKSVKKDKLDGKLYNIHFKEERDGKLKVISFSAKKARGLMCRFAVKNRITDPEGLKAFNEENYLFRDDLSNETEFYFTR